MSSWPKIILTKFSIGNKELPTTILPTNFDNEDVQQAKSILSINLVTGQTCIKVLTSYFFQVDVADVSEGINFHELLTQAYS